MPCLLASIIRPYKVFRLWWHRELWWPMAWKGLDFHVKTPNVVIESVNISAGEKEPEKSSVLLSLSGPRCKEKRGGGLQRPLELSPLGL